MKLVLLGTTGYHPNDLRHTACYCLPELGVVFDAGTGMYRLHRYLATRELDIFLSHAHADHIIGLTYLLGTLYERGVTRTTVHGEPTKLAAVRQHLFNELIFPVLPDFDFRPLEKAARVGNSGNVHSFPLEHPGGAVGYRLQLPDRSLAYVTDTTAHPKADYIDQIRGVDLLIHECYFDDSQSDWATKTGHSCTTPVAQLAREAQVGRLVLVHLNPMVNQVDPVGLDVAQRIFPNTIVGEDLMEIEF